PRQLLTIAPNSPDFPHAMHSPPYLLRCKRRVEMAHPKAGQRVQHRIGHRRWRPDRGHRTDPLGPQRVSRRWHLQRLWNGRGILVGLRESIGQQAPRQWLALRAVDDVFAQGLPEALGDATNNLPFDQSWVDDAATVVDSNVAQDGDLSCLPAPLHDHGM